MIIEGINKDTENIVSIDYTNRKLVVNRNKFVLVYLVGERPLT